MSWICKCTLSLRTIIFGNILPQLKEKGLVNFISKIREKRKANNISKNSRFLENKYKDQLLMDRHNAKKWNSCMLETFLILITHFFL